MSKKFVSIRVYSWFYILSTNDYRLTTGLHPAYALIDVSSSLGNLYYAD